MNFTRTYAELKERYKQASLRNKLLFWCLVYFSAVLVCSLVLFLVSQSAQSTAGSNPPYSDFHKNLEQVYKDGSFYNAECYHQSNVLTKKYNPEQTRKILDESGLMDGTAHVVGASGFVGGRTYRYEPQSAKRPSIVTSTDNMYYSPGSRECILSIIE